MAEFITLKIRKLIININCVKTIRHFMNEFTIVYNDGEKTIELHISKKTCLEEYEELKEKFPQIAGF